MTRMMSYCILCLDSQQVIPSLVVPLVKVAAGQGVEVGVGVGQVHSSHRWVGWARHRLGGAGGHLLCRREVSSPIGSVKRLSSCPFAARRRSVYVNASTFLYMQVEEHRCQSREKVLRMMWMRMDRDMDIEYRYRYR